MHKTIYNNNSNIYVQSLKRKQNAVSRKRVKLTWAGNWKDLFKSDRKPAGMGSLANLFMGHHEKRWLENYNSGIEFYRRYVDDTFALFNTEQDALSFFSDINS